LKHDVFEQLIALREGPVGSPVMLQNWLDLTFIHWLVDPALIQSKLPPGLVVDTLEDQAYLSLVAFTMTGIRSPRLPAVPGLSAFHEWNLRTYVIGPNGPGIWFFSLDAANLVAVLAARAWYKLPYHYATMGMDRTDGSRSYTCRRITPNRKANDWSVQVSFEPELRIAAPRSLEFWLVERYLLYSYSREKLYAGRVSHSPYQLADASVQSLFLNLPEIEGFEGLGAPIPQMQFSPDVSVGCWKLVESGV